MEKSKFFECDCGTHGLVINIDTNKPVIYQLSFWNYGHNSNKLTFWQRLKYCFRYLFKNDMLGDHIILSKEKTYQLINFLKYWENKTENKNIPETHYS